MKFKKICTIGIITILTLTGCKANSEEVVKNGSEVSLDDLIESYEKESKLNPNYANNEDYFDMYERETNLDEIKSKDDLNEEKDTYYIYQPDYINGTDEVLKIEKILISRELSVEEKLIILCDYLENKLEDIEINIQSNIDDKFAVVMAIEKYPVYGSGNSVSRGGMIKETLKQSEFSGQWFEHVEVIYDAGTFGDM